MPKITKLRLHLLKLFRENYWLLFFRTWCIYRLVVQHALLSELQDAQLTRCFSAVAEFLV